ncbi:MAG: AmmeMemoRadiSam system protein A [Planctomycetota bacterium]|jgi:AmmeMemoRadiSam system protein A
MNDIQKKTLLKVACKTVEAILTGGPLPKAGSSDAELNAHCGCFVTLKNQGRLRGCLGQFVSDRPLIELVVEMAKSSATRDPRFFDNMVTAAELQELDIEISVLSELLPTDEPLSLRLGVDGIYIKRGYASGCFLPQVAEEMAWSKEEFLSNCCAHKAGLAPDAWRQAETEVYLFTAEVFGSSFKDILGR